MSKIDLATEEAVCAFYVSSGSYAATARRFGIAKSTAWRIVHRLAGDELEEHRQAARADLCEQAWERVHEVLGLATAANFTGSKGSIAAEASRAAADLARVASMLEPKERNREPLDQPTTIIISSAMPSPLEPPGSGEETLPHEPCSTREIKP